MPQLSVIIDYIEDTTRVILDLDPTVDFFEI
jgi:hypothetical protein